MASPALLPRLAPSTLARVTFNRILFATDFGQASQHAQRYAVALAQLFGARLFAINVESPADSLMPYTEVSPYLLDKIREGRQLQMQKLQNSLQQAGIPFACILESGEINDKIKEVIKKYSIDLVVLGTHGHRGLARLLLGSTAESVFRSVNCPVLTVGPHTDTFDPRQPIEHILYATDFTDESEAAAPYAISLAQEFHARLTAMHVLPEPVSSGPDHERIESFFEQKLRKLVPESGCEWCNVEYLVYQGDPVEKVLEAADQRKVDLIVMGIHNAIGFMSHLPGRTAYQIICDSACPVLTVLPK